MCVVFLSNRSHVCTSFPTSTPATVLCIINNINSTHIYNTFGLKGEFPKRLINQMCLTLGCHAMPYYDVYFVEEGNFLVKHLEGVCGYK